MCWLAAAAVSQISQSTGRGCTQSQPQESPQDEDQGQGREDQGSCPQHLSCCRETETCQTDYNLLLPSVWHLRFAITASVVTFALKTATLRLTAWLCRRRPPYAEHHSRSRLQSWRKAVFDGRDVQTFTRKSRKRGSEPWTWPNPSNGCNYWNVSPFTATSVYCNTPLNQVWLISPGLPTC